MSGGLFVAIVGPSGAGKDSLMRELARALVDDADFALVRRVVTRAAGADEDHVSLDVDEFEAQAAAGRFALTWRAHGLSYGVPVEVDAELAAGKTLVCNLSRASVAAARRRFGDVFVVRIDARPETLAARIAARGRESAEDARARLLRSRESDASVLADASVDNDGELAAAAARLYGLVQQRRRRS